ncbi:o-succinylbenzoate synthase [Rossellomorea vietnamensis]|uniref:o-succinylbenzoate synthase n=1 Tax=Rossellomorea vietnamensis TaxID=218284 RepID=A0A0P6VVX1_9BACI|nr:o-succinylbenzoate synthase [Rossellomorea vietnamensis]KPL59089.1 O-succinylbenzoate synthase [Rossellomorea vietnamensis]
MRIKSVTLHIISMPLKKPFVTHLQKVEEREGIIIEVRDKEGVCGLGEGVAFSTPWYTEETVKTSHHMLKDVLIPLMNSKSFHHPEEIGKRFEAVRGNAMAKAALEMALWDLYARQKGVPLWNLIGGTREEVLAGAVVGAGSIPEMINQAEDLVKEGYQRIKLKISPGADVEIVKELRSHFPNLSLLADANSAYSLEDVPRLQALDEFDLEMIEQPLGIDDLVEHSLLQKEISTPICLDESIVTPHDMRSAIHLNSCGVVNIKLGRVGGYSSALEIYRLCREHDIKVWCGGMIEFGVSRAHNLALSTLEGFRIPGDISSSSKYWEEDIITSPIVVRNGVVDRLEGPGIGVELNRKRLSAVTQFKEDFTLDETHNKF